MWDTKPAVRKPWSPSETLLNERMRVHMSLPEFVLLTSPELVPAHAHNSFPVRTRTC